MQLSSSVPVAGRVVEFRTRQISIRVISVLRSSPVIDPHLVWLLLVMHA